MAQHASKTAQDSSKRAQYGPTTAEDGLKMVQKAPQDGSRGLQEEPLESRKKQKSMVFLRCFIELSILTFPGFRQLKTAQETSKIAPRGPKRAPK